MFVIHRENPLFRLIDLKEKLRKPPQGVGAEYQVHMAVGFPHPAAHPLFLGHAPAQGDDLFGIFPLCVGQDAQVSKDPLFCVFPDGAGIQNHQIRLLWVGGEGEAHLLEHSHEFLSVSHVLLAAKGVHTGDGVGFPAGKHGFDARFKIPLAGQFRLWDQYIFPIQNLFLQVKDTITKIV